MRTLSIGRNKGFTLIELLVVIAIIGILAALLILQFSSVRAKARDTKRVANVTDIRTALEMYYNDFGSYPADLATLETEDYLASVPEDPNGGPYSYAKQGLNYQVATDLEKGVAGEGPLASDADINASTWGGKDGTVETCGSGTGDCWFDLGQN
ncbi:MAG: prepilin-type N-terminal cleavage/methylation domain-containing protein [Parcubacteria group bacterium]